ncbi:MAG: hexitol phosphatase HxpB [Cyclobacteriaceae bacterium]
MLQAAIFDMDGVLVDSEPIWRRAMVAVFAEVGLNITEKECAETTGIRIDKVVEYRYEKSPWKGTSPERTTEMIVEKMVELIYAEAKPMEGVGHLISLFQSKGFKIGLATSSPNSIMNATVDKLGLKEVFHSINSAEFEKYGKPHPAIYLKTAKKLGVEPTDCVAIEDSFYGLLSAKSARMKTIAVPEPAVWEQERFSISEVKVKNLAEVDENMLTVLNNALT